MTFLFTDIEGSTALLRRLGQNDYASVLAEHHSLIRSGLASHDGKEVSTQGDGFFAVFSSASAGLSAAIETQRALSAHEWPAGEQVRVRMGIHSGEVSETSTGLVGLEVHRAARVAAVAHGGQILCSAAAAGLVRDSLPSGASLRDLGLHRLKDLGLPEQIFQVESDGLEFDFAPLRSLDNPALPNNLPAQSASFVGRELELAEVRRLVDSSRLVTLTGSGGSGKTRLALQAAAELLDGSGDGVWLVELATVTDPENVASTVTETLGITNLAGRSTVESLLDALSHQRVLIVLDNCEHLIGACAKFADAVLRRCPEVYLVATSREPLGIGGETIYRVPSLSLPESDEDVFRPGGSDAVALFVNRATAQGTNLRLDADTRPLVISICKRLDGMPLAIELAAARLRSLSLEKLNDRLDQRFRLLTGGSRSALPRQQTLRATVEWSYSLLNRPEQSLLRRLSVFADGFELEAAEAVCGLDHVEAFDIAEILGSLVDKSLVVAEPTGGALRYRLLETIRQFSAERLVEFDELEAAAIAEAHCLYYLTLAETAAPNLKGPEQGRWFERLDAEQANLRHGIEHAVGEVAGTARVLRFAVALQRYWWVRQIYEEAIRCVMPAFERPEAQTEKPLLGEAMITVAVLGHDVDIEISRRLSELALSIGREINDSRLIAHALSVLCGTLCFSGDRVVAYPLGEEAVERARALGDDDLLGECIVDFLLCHDQFDPERRERLFEEAIECIERTSDLFGEMVTRNNIGAAALASGDVPAARSQLERADLAMRAIGAITPTVAINLGWVLREEGDSENARSMFEEGLGTCRRIGDRHGLAYSTLGLACLAGDDLDWHRSAVLHGSAQALLEEMGEAWSEPEGRYLQVSRKDVLAHLGEEAFGHALIEGRRMNSAKSARLSFGTLGLETLQS
ncbi:MAG: adenylate/guanylate cyclase domain-containing protein [Acidimicrobiales bacterium]